ncbi:NADH-quinone oxidoreductase subunit NuoF family protein [Streptomyces gobiensis]|uniref:NADH-quinone oxidoreductase subunit NuoF family protein n=1 Tax=Streptomyces gobiensis TaxID=2875706 RepID=UPI001E5E228D|nr:NADH-quinone oxidoreductase subunit NuoF family protein [Streptomyces gobiensis]UGY90330.1 ferredoxin [Streptomyces gobiensis]
MNAKQARNDAVPTLASVGPPRLLAGLDKAVRLDRVTHLTVHGSLPMPRAEELVELAQNIDLRGRGGAGFPFARKLQSVIDSARRRDGRTAVVVNGSEGEPSCLKDTALLLNVPHLVLDGAVLSAVALGAEEVRVGVTRVDVERSVRAAIEERGPGLPRIQVTRLPERFVTGESTAMTNGLNQGNALPSGRKIRTSDSGLGGLPTLFSNTETYAQLAVAARLGALDYRATGLPSEPGTVLLTVSGARVIETPTGVPLPYILQLCGSDAGQGVLTGGYHGGWLTPQAASSALVSRESLAAAGSGLGAGAVLPLPGTTCPVGETVRVARWMARESAGQCGPCVLGLPALADALERAARGGGRSALDTIRMRINTVTGRGACSHPDGTSRFVEGALNAFPEHFMEHALGQDCGLPVTGALPVPVEPAAQLALPPGPGSGGDKDSERLVVDWTLCQGHGLCADIVPHVIQLGPDGYPERAVAHVPGRLRQQALRAVRRCPALALRIQESASRS